MTRQSQESRRLRKSGRSLKNRLLLWSASRNALMLICVSHLLSRLRRFRVCCLTRRGKCRIGMISIRSWIRNSRLILRKVMSILRRRSHSLMTWRNRLKRQLTGMLITRKSLNRRKPGEISLKRSSRPWKHRISNCRSKIRGSNCSWRSTSRNISSLTCLSCKSR